MHFSTATKKKPRPSPLPVLIQAPGLLGPDGSDTLAETQEMGILFSETALPSAKSILTRDQLLMGQVHYLPLNIQLL